MRRSAKILILNKEGIIEKISYDRRAYASVNEKRLSYRLCPEKTTKKKEFLYLRVKVLCLILTGERGCVGKKL